jgi:superfamily II DNA helicase RecQ
VPATRNAAQSHWGHDYRPDYAKLRVLRQVYPDVQIVALTATATPAVRDDIVHMLALRNTRHFVQDFNRRNLMCVLRVMASAAACQLVVVACVL